MKKWTNNFITERVFKHREPQGVCKYNIHYSGNKTITGVPEQLEILEGNTFYVYNLTYRGEK